MTTTDPLAGLIRDRWEDDTAACEIVTIDSLVEGGGVGRSLIEAVYERAHRAGCARLWVITTNDNQRAQAFYDKPGFRVAAVRQGPVNESRKLKPSIPLVGQKRHRDHRPDRVRASDPLSRSVV